MPFIRYLCPRWLRWATTAMLLMTAVNSMATDANLGEGRLKTAYLHNFIKMVEFPRQLYGNFNFCILGNVSFSDHLSALDGQPRGAALISLKLLPAHGDMNGCHALFIPADARGELHDLLEKAENMGILTIGDSEGYTQAGVILNLKLVQGKLRFDVNMKTAHRSSLKISANLLRLAQTIEE